ncbi:carboxypeptidase-like regulatory domain-containing protein [Prevotella sp. 10(H)]|uniref:TonB-dependent receptor n=1 Tax=Prevotella sp. 10(H) TaxID=1158294 RepID=UPI0004A781DE|nr:carboxypeptidase-like regulatory domain-containing protein [Prevotella sp. 10(H)]
MAKKYFLLLFLLISAYAFPQKVKIAGIVTDKENRPIEHVSVSQPNTTNGTLTNRYGFYELEVMPDDSVKVVFSLIGYQKHQYIIPGLAKDYNLSITMQPADNTLAPVTVEGERMITVVIGRIDYIATKRPSNPWNSIESLLATMGGVSSTNELSSQYSVRGGNFDENIVYVNGVEIYRPMLVRSAQQEGLSFINPNMVKTVSFSAGSFSAEYDDKMSSVLDITYKRPERFEGVFSAGLLGGEVYVGNSTERFSQITSVRYKTLRSLLSTGDTKADYDPSFLDFQTYITYKLSSRWEASFLGNYSYNKYEFTPKTRETSFGTLANARTFKVHFNGWENDKFLTYQGAFTLKGKVTDNLNLGLTASAFSSDEQERYDIEGRYLLEETNFTGENESIGSPLGIGTYMEHARNKLKSDVYTFSHFGDLKIDKNLLKWGFSFRKEKVEDKIKEWEMRDSAGYSLPSTGTDVNLFSNLRSDNRLNPSRISGFIQDTYTLNTDKGLFVLNAGLRGSYWTYNEEFIISSRGALAFVPAGLDNLSLRIAGGLYYQAPFYKELQRIVKDVNGNNVIEPNKDIKSQKSVQIVLGADYYFGRDDERGIPPFKLSGEIYYKKLSDLIPYTVNNVKIRYTGENSSKGYSMGADVKLYGEFIPGADSWISLSVMKTQQDIDGVKVPLPTDQRFNLALFYQDYFPGYERLKMSLRGLWSQGLPVSAPYKGYETGYFRTPNYKRIDIGFSWLVLGEDFAIRNTNSFCRAFKNIWLSLDAFNIFDMQNTNTYYWITDVHNQHYAVPNYLTGRQMNVRLLAEF